MSHILHVWRSYFQNMQKDFVRHCIKKVSMLQDCLQQRLDAWLWDACWRSKSNFRSNLRCYHMSCVENTLEIKTPLLRSSHKLCIHRMTTLLNLCRAMAERNARVSSCHQSRRMSSLLGTKDWWLSAVRTENIKPNAPGWLSVFLAPGCKGGTPTDVLRLGAGAGHTTNSGYEEQARRGAWLLVRVGGQ